MKSEAKRSDVLRTKLHRPPVGPELVRRARLLECMDRGRATGALILVSAPAGYGKSVVVSQWLEAMAEPHAWLSLDEGDGDLRRFLQHLIAALEALFPGACERTAVSLTATDLPPAAPLAEQLIGELDLLEASWVVVLDDYHRLKRDSPVHDFMSRFLESPPSGAHLVLITRRDPSISLLRLRPDFRFDELRQRDLCFSEAESAHFLSQAAVPRLSPAALHAVHDKVEGWAAGLRLLFMALRYADDADLFVREMGEGLQVMQEYLLQEVLAGLPPETRRGMLRTSVLNRFCEGLVDAVCAEPGDERRHGEALLETVQRENLFAIRLDARGQWLRYHHLFQGLLQTRLRETHTPAEVAGLHERAAVWFESEAFVEEAIEHALAAGDEDEAAAIVVRHRTAELEADRWHVVKRWLGLLSERAWRDSPALLLAELWGLYESFQHERMPPLLDRVESLLAEAPDEDLRGELLFFRGALQYWSGEGERSRRSMEEARACRPEDRRLVGGLIEIYRGLTAAMAGEKSLAVRELSERVAEGGSQDAVYQSRLFAGLHFVHLLSADLVAGRRDAERLHSVATVDSIAYTQAWGCYMQACTDLHACRLEDASRRFAVVTDQRYIFNALAAIDAVAGLVLARELGGEPLAADEACGRLEAFAAELGIPLCSAVAESARARLALRRGDLASAARWAEVGGGIPGPAELWIWLEVPAITRARVLVAMGTDQSLGEAVELLGEIRRRTEAWHFVNQTIEVAVLEALARDRQGAADEALQILEHAVALACPGGWVRSFVEAGPRASEMLRGLSARGTEVDFIGKILTASAAALPQGRPQAATASAALVDPLTHREIDVLELLAARLQNKEIAARLSVSTHTVNSHLKRVYRKLGVNGRRQAVARAIDLGVIAKEPPP